MANKIKLALFSLFFKETWVFFVIYFGYKSLSNKVENVINMKGAPKILISNSIKNPGEIPLDVRGCKPENSISVMEFRRGSADKVGCAL